MKKTLICILAAAAMCLTAGGALASVLLTEDFPYASGQLLTATGYWSAHSGSGTNAITVNAGDLSYAGYPAGVPNLVAMTTSGEDDHTTAVMSHTSGPIYMAFLADFSAAQTGDYFAHFYQSSTSFYGRVFCKLASGSLNFGVTKGSGTANYSTVPFTLNTTHLIVVKYTMNSGTLNDTADLWVDPVIGAMEPAPLVSATDTGSTDGTSFVGIALRQGSGTAAPTQRVDGIRVATTWYELFGLQPTGACCAPNGTCTQTAQTDCAYDWHAEWTTCDPNPCPVPPDGACCFSNGTCLVLLEADCAAQGGAYLGGGTVCDPNPCPQPGQGACCFANGSCAVLTEPECFAQGGEYQGDTTLCEPNPCPQPVPGACCFPAGTCTMLTTFDCAAQGGSFQGEGVSCSPNPCPFPQHTLCDVAADDVNGVPLLVGQLVEVEGVAHVDNGVWNPTTTQFEISDGSCCTSVFGGAIVPVAIGDRVRVRGTVILYNGLTEISTPDLQISLLSSGNPIYGPGAVTTGELGTNGEPYEACLVSISCASITSGAWPVDGQNANLTIDDGSGPVTLRIDKDTNIDGSPAPTGPINLVGVVYQFDSSSPYTTGYQILPRSLADITVCSPPGACCAADGSCQVLTAEGCAGAGGQFLGAGIPCEPNPCEPLGACCLPDGTCQMSHESDCTAPNTWKGALVPCDPNPCVPVAVEEPLATTLGLRIAPNPFAGEAGLTFAGPRGTAASLMIVDAAGRKIRTAWAGVLDGRKVSFRWDGRDDNGREVASGTYLARLRGGSKTVVTRFVKMQ